jgi:trk system potassium uptake protein TrkH
VAEGPEPLGRGARRARLAARARRFERGPGEGGPLARMLARVPLLYTMGIALSLSMQLPALHALLGDDHDTARAFFYWGLLSALAMSGVAVAAARPEPTRPARAHLLALLGAFALLPALAALPMREVVPDARFSTHYAEMVMAATTTGGSLFAPDRLPLSAHLWRALVAWQGGLLIWIAAAAVLAPLRLGGSEVIRASPRVAGLRVARDGLGPRPSARLIRIARALTPVYVALTGALWLLLSAAGAAPTEAAILAMSTLATSGITAGSDAQGLDVGLAGEAAIMAFLVFAITRRAFASDLHGSGGEGGRVRGLLADRELRMAAAITGAVVLALMARHVLAGIDWAAEETGMGPLRAAAGAAWGAAFTVLSFLTTTGFLSSEWALARAWSGFETPGVLLLGLTMFGGGVATTAGGVKLLRVWALYQHGRREMDLLVHPSAVTGGRHARERLPESGLEAAWIFFMLYATSLAGTTLLLTLAGAGFQQALILATAALSTTGPILDAILPLGPGIIAESGPIKAVFVGAMVLGRLETLALLALFNPDFWRR